MVSNALATESATPADFAALLSPVAPTLLESMARQAQSLTRRHFGRTISLYAPLYLSDYCGSGCAYCGFAADRPRRRRRLETDEMIAEMDTMKAMGFDEILLLTGERNPKADFDYLRQAVALAAERFHLVTIETFPMTVEEYRELAQIGCTGLTLYQETYDPEVYARLHRWGPKQNYMDRVESPARALSGGLRTAGLGILLGLADPVADAIALYRHIDYLRKNFWQAGISVSFPRIRPQQGGFMPAFTVDDRFLAQLIFAFRLCMPDVTLTLSTRESAAFRDGMAGIGICKMSIASKTTVGGYHYESLAENGQFIISDNRDMATFCAMLHRLGFEPVLKNWDSVFR
ncbi:MAG: 2-iminoacetate synthase ThiH [Verrucomicrobia bacterium]|nr:2-iminoacetate synthase ThiH [Verrucomicrobiota bacterium]MBU4246747.1 2-iminoacetate synthase ThiH [Verrucomicrobiota bacterium]MBU4291168.1 2-iminoacetate synthase ThiH [Verrucomicrobiota bacterium]MBU4429881.1 2-iminoacetate synthase ThiH [Verrucomicrobiota bacterium]MBU4496926.1 2-iminoacetate synthase ThiH [Verrucomicrobiota bacterium]